MSENISKGRDPVEVAAFQFLTGRYHSVCHEPNGPQTFPDFSTEGDLIFEVTRLEKSVQGDYGQKSHSELYIPLIQSFEKKLKEFPSDALRGHNHFLNLRMKFPLGRRAAQKALSEFLVKAKSDIDIVRAVRHQLVDGLSCEVIRGSPAERPFLMIGLIGLPNLTGFVVPDTIKQLKDALVKKSPKLEKYKRAYREAWLIVGGGASKGFRRENLDYLSELEGRKLGWKGAVILNFNDPAVSLEFEFV